MLSKGGSPEQGKSKRLGPHSLGHQLQTILVLSFLLGRVPLSDKKQFGDICRSKS